jgi:tagatose-1,6-bisphosphate aldolase non-catalytic subunit AgaZ/GatZ
MLTIKEMIDRTTHMRRTTGEQITLLAICPNSAAVLEAAIKSAAQNNAPMLLAATLNQIDRDGGYTGWTPARFVTEMRIYIQKYAWRGPVYPCLDHGGPWLKDDHRKRELSLEETTAEVKQSLSAMLEAGYQLLHIDPTIDITLPPGETMPIIRTAERIVDLIAYAEGERKRMRLPPVSYETGSEEVKGGIADIDSFRAFIKVLRIRLIKRGLSQAWPCFIVGNVGTDLHTTDFDPKIAKNLYEIVAPLGSLIKGHYTDWVANPEQYPRFGMGGANIGPELTAEEYLALRDLVKKERDVCRARPDREPSGFLEVLESAVVSSGRWEKWRQPDEKGKAFDELTDERREWLVQTGARYVWARDEVVEARDRLYENLKPAVPDPNGYVVDRIVAAIDKYMLAFNLCDSLAALGAA